MTQLISLFIHIHTHIDTFENVHLSKMPKGLPPDVSAVIQQLSTRLNQSFHEAVVYFEIPSYSELRSSCITAISVRMMLAQIFGTPTTKPTITIFHLGYDFMGIHGYSIFVPKDSIVAFHSLRKLLILSLRPIYILAVWISLHLWAVLKVLFEHMLHHGKQICNRGVQYQKSLSREAIYMELVVFVALGLLYALRRYIQKKKYIERLCLWYILKRNRLQKRYKDLVNKVAETSILVALLLPHVLYLISFGMIRYFLPNSLEYVATQTKCISVISFWFPFVQTVVLISKWQHHELHLMAIKDTSTTEHSHSSTPDPKKSNKFTAPEKKVQTILSTTTSTSDMLCKDISNRLMYWIVYSVLASSFQIMQMLPLLGGFFPNGRDQTKFQLSHRSCEEIKLFFFLWLQLLSRGDYEPSMDVKPKSSKKGLKEKSRSFSTWSDYDQSSLCIVYDRIKPVLGSFTKNLSKFSSITPSSDHESSDDRRPLSSFHRIIQFAGLFLDFAVRMKALSRESINSIINTFFESFPALLSLFMPSYFTKFGVIYLSSIVPASHSAHALEVLKGQVESAPMSVQCLEYWVLYAILSMIISGISYVPIISWLIFSTRAQLLLWMVLQIKIITKTLYGFFNEELIFFGILKSPVEGHRSCSILVRMIALISQRLNAANQKNTSEVGNT